MPFNIVPRSLWQMPSLWEDDEDVANWAPTSGVTISEDEKNVFVSAHLPGVSEEDVDMTFDKGMLWIKADTKEEEEDKKKKYYRKATSNFSYRVAVPGDIDLSSEPQAEYKNGIITVTFVKSVHAQPKKITVKSKK